MNEIEITNRDIDYREWVDNKEFLKWINEELEINSKYPFHNKDFNKLSGIELTVIYDLDRKESKESLFNWLIEEVFLNPHHYFKKDLLQKLSINVNEE